MPMNKRTESIRLKHLQDIYYEKLQGIAYDVYDEQLHNLIIRPEDRAATGNSARYDSPRFRLRAMRASASTRIARG